MDNSASIVIRADLGTQTTKTVVAAADGGIVRQHAQAYQVETPRLLWAQQWQQVWLAEDVEASLGVLQPVRRARSHPEISDARIAHHILNPRSNPQLSHPEDPRRRQPDEETSTQCRQRRGDGACRRNRHRPCASSNSVGHRQGCGSAKRH
jgi:hypothetical protein